MVWELLIKYVIITIFFELSNLIILKEYKNKIIILCIVINLITNPIFNYFGQKISLINYNLYLIIGEIIVIIIETIFYYLLLKNFKRSAKISLTNNIVSLIFGILL